MNKIPIWLSITLILITFAACNADVPASVKTDDVSYLEPQMMSKVSSEFSEATVDTAPKAVEGTVRTSFTLGYLTTSVAGQGYDTERSAEFSFDFPDEWTCEASADQVIISSNNKVIGQIELIPRSENISALFSDIDEMGFATYSTKKFPVSEYPAKLYVLKTNTGSGGESGVMPSCSFYIAPDMLQDAYISILFHPGTGTKEELESIVSSLIFQR